MTPADLDPAGDWTAAELALGVLDGEDRAAAVRRMLADRAFAREVDDWRDRLAPMLEDYAPLDAPAQVGERIERTLDSTGDSTVAAPRTFPWRVATAAMTALAACLLVVVARPISPPPAAPPPVVAPRPAAPLIAALAGSTATPLAAAYDSTTAEVRIAGAVTIPAGRSAQLWAIGKDAVPRPLGLLALAPASKLVIAADRRRWLASGVTLAVSIEPLGGSPTGLPTGPVVASGALSAI